MMKKICVFTLYPEKGASSKYRYFIYEEELKKKFIVKAFSFWNDAYVERYMHYKKENKISIIFLYIISAIKRFFQILFVASKCDVVLFQKACIPKCSYDFISFLKKKKIRILFDVDDAIYIERRNYSNKIAKQADVVICGNEFIGRHYKKYNENIVVLPTVENTKLFRPYWKDTYENKTIGWIGSLTTIDNLDLVVNSINRVVEEFPKVNFLIISNSALDYTKKIKNARLIKWNKDTYISDLSDITIGIMPLKKKEFNQGKCGFKLVQYLNLKKPVIASDIGVNKKIVGLSGIMAESEDEWYEAFKELLTDEKKYKKMVSNIEQEFFEMYNYKKNLIKLESILQG